MTVAMMKQILPIGIMMEVTAVELALTTKNVQSVSIMKKLYQQLIKNLLILTFIYHFKTPTIAS